MGTLLIAAVIDLDAGESTFAGLDDLRDRVANSLAIGLGGPVGSQPVEGGILFSRPTLRDAPPTRLGSRPRPWRATRGPDGAYVLFAGEIFEKRDLAAGLPNGPSLADDGALYAHALAHHGARCDRLVNGQYASIAWYPDEGRVRIARSPIEAPPLHIWRSGSMLVVASSVRAAFAAGAPEEIDQTKLADALYLNFRDASRGWYRGIERIVPGEIAQITRAGTRKEIFWSIDDIPAQSFARDEDYVDAVRDAFVRASQAMVTPFRSPALQLSGGLDSQAVGSFALDAMPEVSRLKAYCWVPQDGFEPLDWPRAVGDEREGAAAFAKMHDRVDLELVDTGDLDLDHREENFFLLAGTAPMGGMNMHWGYETLRRASADRHDVMLTGTAGNVTFSYDGLTGPPTWLRQGRIAKSISEIAALGGNRPLWRRFISEAMMPQLPVRWRQKWARRRGTALDPFDSWCGLDRGNAIGAGILERAERDGHDPLFLDMRSSRQWRKAVVAMAGSEGGDSLQAMELLYGIPFRDPTSFRPLYELCAGIPDDQYLRNGTTRWLARRLLQGRVPEKVRTTRRLGIQSSDWPVRFARERDAMLGELTRLESDPQMARLLDIPRLRQSLIEWSGKDSVGGLEAARIFSAVGRSLIAARFHRYSGGSND